MRGAVRSGLQGSAGAACEPGACAGACRCSAAQHALCARPHTSLHAARLCSCASGHTTMAPTPRRTAWVPPASSASAGPQRVQQDSAAGLGVGYIMAGSSSNRPWAQGRAGRVHADGRHASLLPPGYPSESVYLQHGGETSTERGAPTCGSKGTSSEAHSARSMPSGSRTRSSLNTTGGGRLHGGGRAGAPFAARACSCKAASTAARRHAVSTQMGAERCEEHWSRRPAPLLICASP